jgi:predicted PurR-regulated permease PerM
MGSGGSEELRTGFKFPTLVGIVVVIAGLYFGRQVLIPLALGMVLAVLFGPIVVGLEKCHFGRVPSVLAALVLFASLEQHPQPNRGDSLAQ